MRSAIQATVRDVVVDIAQDAIKGSPHLTGNNRRSIAYKVEGMGMGTHPQPRQAGDNYAAEEQVEAEAGKLEFNQGAVYPTSGYGGILEVGTSRMSARPYLEPALRQNFTETKVGKLLKEHLGEK
jgi:hypothetical protein